MDSARDGRGLPQRREANARLAARVRRAALLWWFAACVFSCLLNFVVEAPRDWPGDLVNYAAGSAAGAAWSLFLAWRLERRRDAGRAEAFWMGLGLAALGGCASGLIAGLICWPVIVNLRLEQIVSYQIGFDLEHYTTLSVAWYFICSVQISVERRSAIEEDLARLRVLVLKAEDAELREQVRPERLRGYFSRLSSVLDQRLQKEAEGLVLTLSDGLSAALSSRVARAPGEESRARSNEDAVLGLELDSVQRVAPASGVKFTTRVYLLNFIFWLSAFLLLFATLAPTYAKSSHFIKLYTVSAWGGFCIIGYVSCFGFVRLWGVVRGGGSLLKNLAYIGVVYLVSALVSAFIVDAAAEFYFDHVAPSINLVEIYAAYYFTFFVVWHCVYSYSQAAQREAAQRVLLARAAEAAAAARNSMLRYQVRPHFLFNALNALYALIVDRQWVTARAMTQALSHYFERSFAEDERELVPIGEQVEVLQAYLTIEKIRFGDRLRCRVDIPEGLTCARAPSLILQPLIENAMKYAVASTADPVDVEIAADLIGDTLLLRVRDSGGDPEASAAPGLGIGLRNVVARLAGHYGERGSLQCKRLTPKGFVAEVRLPLEYVRAPVAA